jgi:hypothetical protein
MYDVKLALKGVGLESHQERTPGNVSHQAIVSDQRSHTSSGIVPACD